MPSNWCTLRGKDGVTLGVPMGDVYLFSRCTGSLTLFVGPGASVTFEGTEAEIDAVIENLAGKKNPPNAWEKAP